jgi:hypothetical protein
VSNLIGYSKQIIVKLKMEDTLDLSISNFIGFIVWMFDLPIRTLLAIFVDFLCYTTMLLFLITLIYSIYDRFYGEFGESKKEDD